MNRAPRVDVEAGLPTYRPLQVEKVAPCQVDCASGIDVRGWIGVISQRSRTGLTNEEAYEKAWRILTKANPFPAIMGRICPHPCQAGCSRTDKDGPVAINALERFIGDWAIDQALLFERADAVHPESIGVIGAGPSGLTFAYHMARRGYQVVIYDQNPEPGGMLRYGVPDYRLPPAILDAEIGRIIDLGVELRVETSIGLDLEIDTLRERHKVLYLGIGAQSGRLLGLPDERGAGVLTGIDYLGRVNRGEEVEVGSRVVVIGGGNTAIDAARVARRAGADVMILYRRSRSEMPAVDGEIDEAMDEGVAIEFLAAPIAVVRDNGCIRQLTVQRVSLGDVESDGRRKPVPLPGSEFTLATDTVIAAVSQVPDRETLEHIGVPDAWLDVSEVGELLPGLWAGGDVLGPDIAGNAIKQGRSAAATVHARLRGLADPPSDPRRAITPLEITLDSKDPRRGAVGRHRTVTEALSEPTAEVSLTITEGQFLAEVERCFSCGLCFGCSSCWMYCTVGSFTKTPITGPGNYFTMALDQCQECGKCIEVCPCGYLEAVL